MCLILRDALVEDLERDGALQGLIGGAEDGAEAALPDLLVELIEREARVLLGGGALTPDLDGETERGHARPDEDLFFLKIDAQLDLAELLVLRRQLQTGDKDEPGRDGVSEHRLEGELLFAGLEAQRLASVCWLDEHHGVRALQECDEQPINQHDDVRGSIYTHTGLLDGVAGCDASARIIAP